MTKLPTEQLGIGGGRLHSRPHTREIADAAALKGCCAAVYEGEAVRFLLGGSWHPGGVRLSEEMARQAGISARDRVLDVACGRGASALAVAGRFGCSVVGVDLSAVALA